MVFKCFSAPNTVEASRHSHRGYPVFTAAISIVLAHPITTRFKKKSYGNSNNVVNVVKNNKICLQSDSVFMYFNMLMSFNVQCTFQQYRFRSLTSVLVSDKSK